MRVKAYMAAYFLAQAVYQGYISLFYRARGLDAAGLGALCALSAAASIPGQLLFGAAADRARVPGRVLRALLLSSSALLVLQTFARGRFALFALAALFGFAYTPVQPIGDALALERLSREGRPFGPARLMGALAFAASALVFGFFLDASGREGLVALSAAALMLFALLASFLLGGEKRPREKVRPLRLLKDRRLLCLLLFVLPAQATMGYFYAFFPTRFLELPGATGALLGWANLISALAEVPFLLVGDRVFRRWGAAGTVAAATLALCARWLLTGLGESIWALFAAQLLHGLGYIAISLSMALYIQSAGGEGGARLGAGAFERLLLWPRPRPWKLAGRRGGARVRGGGRLHRLRAFVPCLSGSLFPCLERSVLQFAPGYAIMKMADAFRRTREGQM